MLTFEFAVLATSSLACAVGTFMFAKKNMKSWAAVSLVVAAANGLFAGAILVENMQQDSDTGSLTTPELQADVSQQSPLANFTFVPR